MEMKPADEDSKPGVTESNERVADRPKVSQEKIKRVLELLDRDTGNAPMAGDEIPSGYQPS